MPAYTGRFELAAPGEAAVGGACDLTFDRETLTLASTMAPLSFDLGDVDVFVAGDFELGLTLFSGHQLALRQFGKSFEPLRRDLLAAYRDRLVTCLLLGDLDEVARFEGRFQLESSRHVGAGPAEIRLYESNLAILPDTAPGFQWRLADVEAVEFHPDDYTVTVRARDAILTLGRLAKRTGELADRLHDRLSALAERGARALHAVMPFLGPAEFMRVSAALREGESVPIGSLRRVHRLLEPTLMDVVVEPALRPYVAALASRAIGDWYVGYKIVRAGGDAANGVEPDAELQPAGDTDGDSGGADPPARATPSTLEGSRSVLDLGDGLEALFWFFFPIAKAGDTPTHVAWEATSRGGRATYLFRLAAADGPGAHLAEEVHAIGRGLAALNFRREPIYLPSDALASQLRYRHYAVAARRLDDLARVRGRFGGRAIHSSVPAWTTQIDRLL